MGCDMGGGSESVPYCKPKCGQFRLVVHLDWVKAKCVICSLEREFTVHQGQILVNQDKQSYETDVVMPR